MEIYKDMVYPEKIWERSDFVDFVTKNILIKVYPHTKKATNTLKLGYNHTHRRKEST